MEQNQGNRRRHFSPDQKFKIIKESLTTKASISDICKKYDISPTAFYRWQDRFLRSAQEGFRKSEEGPSKAELRKIQEQEQKILKMQSAISEIIQENIELKKSLGESGLL